VRRFCVVLAVCLVAAASSTAAQRDGSVRFRGAGVSFTHPAEWKARFAGYLDTLLRRYLIVALSTEHLQRPVCTYVQNPDGTTSYGCGPILDTLPEGGVYITWWEDASGIDLNRKLIGVPGAVTRLRGRLTKVDIEPTSVAQWGVGICPKGTTGSVGVVVAGTEEARRGARFMVACVNTTNFPGFFRQLLPMLRSTSIRD
jgi:hypothetical protein